jgi:hypothetical protein
MGRDLLSVTGLAHKLIDELRPLAEMLAPSDRRVVEGYFDAILQERVAIASATDLLPLEAAFVILLLEERKRNNHEITELYRQLQELRDNIERLKSET